MNKMNMIWIFSDQQPAYMLSCNGDPNVNTPNIDRLARQGVNFRGAVSGFPLCCPFRGSLLTSRYPHKCVPGHEYPLDPALPTVAHAFKEAGYHTSYFGKWHLDGYKEKGGRAAWHHVAPERRGGFDQWVGFDNNNSQYDCYVHGTGCETHRRLEGYETDCLTDLLIEKIKSASDDQPFFSVLSVQPPHNPYVAPAEYMRRFNPRQLELRPNMPASRPVEDQARDDLSGAYAMVENLDWNVGRVIEALEEKNMLLNTHILFFSDHGDMHGSHGQFKKMTFYEESVRIPMILGGGQPHGYTHWIDRDNHVPMNHVDIAPTSLGLCGVPVPEWMEGTNYAHRRLKDPAVETLTAAEPGHAFIQSVIPTGHGDSVNKPWRGVVTEDGWKYACFENVSWLMFNLKDDPYEQVNLAHNSKYDIKRRELIALVKGWIERTGDSFALPDF